MKPQETPSFRSLLNAKQTAAALNISERQVFTLTQDGKLPYVRIGGPIRGSVRYRPQDLEAFVESHLTTTTAERKLGQTIRAGELVPAILEHALGALLTNDPPDATLHERHEERGDA